MAKMVGMALMVKLARRAKTVLTDLASILILCMRLSVTLLKLLLLTFLFLLLLLAVSVDTLIVTAIFATRLAMVQSRRWALLSVVTARTLILHRSQRY